MNQIELDKILYGFHDRYRSQPWQGSSATSLTTLLEYFGENKISYSLEEAPIILNRFYSRMGSRYGVVYPEFISRFVGKYLSEISAAKILDPYAHHGDLVAQALRITGNANITGWVSQFEIYEFLQTANDSGDSFELGAFLANTLEKNQKFDAIISFLPFGARLSPDYADLISQQVKLFRTKNKADALLIKACEHLSDDGKALFLTDPSFIFGPSRSDRLLADRNLFISSVLSVPAGSLNPYTGIPTILVELTRQRPKDLFVGELSNEDQIQNALLQNLLARRPGKVLPLGALTELSKFQTFDHFVAEKEFQVQVRKGKFKPISVKNVVLEINLPKRNAPSPFPERANAIYLPALGTSRVVDQLEHATVKPQNLMQLVIDPNITNAAFLAKFLNTDFGRKLRGLYEQGFIPRISKSRLEVGDFYLPGDPKFEPEVLWVDTRITEAIGQLDSMRRQAWEQPARAKHISKELNRLVKLEGQSLEEWSESLPFPLASILWSYLAEPRVRERATHLIHFFEALAVFAAVMLLSGFKNKNLYQMLTKETKESGSAFQDWGRAASFGNWVTVGERYAKTLRRAIADKDLKESVLRSFGEPELAFLDMLTSKDIFSLLWKANVWRNRWTGHAPNLSDQQFATALRELENLLAELKTVIADHYQDVRFISPGTSKFRGGVYTYSAALLMGTRTPFKKIAVDTVEVMEDGVIHCIYKDKLYPLPILPFVRLGNNPKQESSTAYFYSRLTDQGPRFVAYQFSDEPEAFMDDLQIREALSFIVESGS